MDTVVTLATEPAGEKVTGGEGEGPLTVIHSRGGAPPPPPGTAPLLGLGGSRGGWEGDEDAADDDDDDADADLHSGSGRSRLMGVEEVEGGEAAGPDCSQKR